ncbi:MAG: hypothetical protein JJ974_07850 [Phycisphaerales bacterium]|nr:hypothetical protein [Phycisphaerales bacterium]
MKSLAFFALTGIVSSSFAQSASLNIVPSEPVVGEFGGSSSFTLSIFASADFGTHIAGGQFSLVNGTGGAGVITGMDAAAVDWASIGEHDRGWAGGANYTGLVFGQIIVNPIIPPNVNSGFAGGEVLVATIQVEFVQPSMFWHPIHFQLGSGPGPFVLEIYDEADGSFTHLQSSAIEFGGASVLVVPAPSSMVLLGLSSFIAVRRNR